MRAAAYILVILAFLFIARHWGDSAHNRLLVDAGAIQGPKELTYFPQKSADPGYDSSGKELTPSAVPTESAPLLLPPQFCPSPWPIYPGAAKRKAIA